MNGISFESFYDEDPKRGFVVFLWWLNDFLESFGHKVAIDETKAKALFKELSSRRGEGFPANGGYVDASPFKKAAFLYVCLHMEAFNPFVLTLPREGDETQFESPSHISTIIGFALVQACLDGAEIMKNGNPEVLGQRIDVSDHYLTDLIQASQGITLEGHFKTYSLLFESLAYQNNTGISYEKRFNLDTSEMLTDRPYWY